MDGEFDGCINIRQSTYDSSHLSDSQYNIPDKLTSRVDMVGLVGSPSSLARKLPFSEMPALAITMSM
jgi:hypothetical protein